MGVYESVLSPSCVLNEQLARQIFDVLPEHGPIVIFLDRDSNCWPSNSEEFLKLEISESFIKELCSRIDDGVEPVITQVCDTCIAAAQLATEHTNCGYVIIALPRYTSESALVNIGLIETLLNQVTLIVKLVEKNRLLCEHQVRQSNIYDRNVVSSN